MEKRGREGERKGGGQLHKDLGNSSGKKGRLEKEHRNLKDRLRRAHLASRGTAGQRRERRASRENKKNRNSGREAVGARGQLCLDWSDREKSEVSGRLWMSGVSRGMSHEVKDGERFLELNQRLFQTRKV